jgi:carboxypeptidase C (cathepsin A)
MRALVACVAAALAAAAAATGVYAVTAAAAATGAAARPAAAAAAAADRLTMRPIAPPASALGGGAGDAPRRYAGTFSLNHTADAHMFFFLFEAREPTDETPLVLWMTGGPGCSSELAVFYENGPWEIDPKSLKLAEREWGWDRGHHMVRGPPRAIRCLSNHHPPMPTI